MPIENSSKRLAFSFYLCKYRNMFYNIKAKKKESAV